MLLKRGTAPGLHSNAFISHEDLAMQVATSAAATALWGLLRDLPSDLAHVIVKRWDCLARDLIVALLKGRQALRGRLI